MRIAVTVHLFYIDLAAEIFRYLDNIPARFDLFLMVPRVRDDSLAVLENAAKKLSRVGRVSVRECPNRGRNFGPLFVELRSLLKDYEIFLHIHSKKSLYSGNEQSEWRSYLLNALLNVPNVHQIISSFESDANLGILYPSTYPSLPYWANTWLSSSHIGQELFGKLNIAWSAATRERYFAFPVGSMFWARSTALQPILDYPWNYNDFPEEKGQTDGTIAHAIERSLVFIARSRGYDFIEITPTAFLRNEIGMSFLTYERQSLSALTDRIDECEVISFDLFDTLVTRAAPTPDAVLHYVGCVLERDWPGAGDFFEIRKSAESLARARGGNDVTMDEIYAVFSKVGGWPAAQVAAARAKEIELELAVSVARHTVVSALAHAKSRGKRVICVSDTYMPRPIVSQILERHGLENKIDELYLSCERNARKDRGDLWPLVLSQENVVPSLMLHIGDNEQSDLQKPSELGIGNFHVMNPAVLIERLQPSLGEFLGRDATQLVLGPVVAKIGNNPFLENRSSSVLALPDSAEFGYCVLGPLVFGFFSWLLRHPTLKVIEHVYFLSREGYFLHKIYDLILKKTNRLLPTATYFYCSRTAASACIQAKEFDPAKIIAAQSFVGTLATLLKARLDYVAPEDYPLPEVSIKLPDDAEFVSTVIGLLRPRIENFAKRRCEAFFDYCRAEGITRGGNYGLVDVGYAASMQRSLQELLGKGLVGFYFGTDRGVSNVKPKGGMAFGCYCNPFDISTMERFISRSLLLEALLGAPHGQVRGFEISKKSTIPIFKEARTAQKNFAEIQSVQLGATNYVSDLLDAYGAEILDADLELAACEIMFNVVAAGEVAVSNALRSALSVEDDWSGVDEQRVGDLLPPVTVGLG